jgi:DNA repair protein RecO (recombination protein O)
MRNFQTEGLILKSRNLGENDKIVIILTKDFGKIEAKAKGSRKLLSQFTGHLEPISICNLALYRSTKDFLTITQCKTKKTFKKIKNNLPSIQKALEITELINKNVETEHPLENLYEFTVQTLEKIEDSETEETEKITNTYIIGLLKILGLLPDRPPNKQEIRRIIEKHLNLPQMSFSTRSTFLTPSILSKILSN